MSAILRDEPLPIGVAVSNRIHDVEMLAAKRTSKFDMKEIRDNLQWVNSVTRELTDAIQTRQDEIELFRPVMNAAKNWFALVRRTEEDGEPYTLTDREQREANKALAVLKAALISYGE